MLPKDIMPYRFNHHLNIHQRNCILVQAVKVGKIVFDSISDNPEEINNCYRKLKLGN